MPSLSASARTILVHGHRGARALRPENTLPAFQYAIDLGVDVLELDLAVSLDNHLVVSHSPYLTQPVRGPRDWDLEADGRKCLGPALPPGTLLRSLTLAEIKQYDCGSKTPAAFPRQVAMPGTKIPTFDEVLDLAPQGQFQFNVETKIFPNHPEMTPSPEAFVELIYDAVRKRSLQSRMILQSFDFRTLKAMRELDPQIRLSALIGEAGYDLPMGIADQNKSFAHVIDMTGADILSPVLSLVTPAEVAIAHERNVQVVPYTANTPMHWQRLADARVDAIITDDPAALLNWLRSQAPPLHP